jgi:hypothetical protein
MAAKKSMSESLPSNPELRESALAYRAADMDDLELPVNPQFQSCSPTLGPEQYVDWCEEYMRLKPGPPMLRSNDSPVLRPDFSL